MTFGQRVALLRTKKGLTQKELGEMVGTSGDIVSRYERNVMVPSLDVAVNFARALETSLDYLAMDENLSNTSTSPNILTSKLEHIERLSDTEKSHIVAVIDAFLTASKLQALIN